MKKKIIFIFSFLICIISCNKEETFTKTKTTKKYTIVITYKGDQPIRSVTYDKTTNKKKFDYQYNVNGKMRNATKYYINGNIESKLKLYSLPDVYFCEEYFPNGIFAGEGNVIFLHEKKILRTGSWIIYKKDGSVYAFAEYIADMKKEIQVLIKKQIIPNNIHLVKKGGKLVDSKKENL